MGINAKQTKMNFSDEYARAHKLIRGYDQIKEKLKRIMNSSEVIQVVRMDDNDKIIFLRHHLNASASSRTILITSNKADSEIFCSFLRDRGLRPNYIHTNTDERERERILMSFNQKKEPILTLTEAAAVCTLQFPEKDRYIGFDIRKGETLRGKFPSNYSLGFTFMLKSLAEYPLLWL